MKTRTRRVVRNKMDKPTDRYPDRPSPVASRCRVLGSLPLLTSVFDAFVNFAERRAVSRALRSPLTSLSLSLFFSNARNYFRNSPGFLLRGRKRKMRACRRIRKTAPPAPPLERPRPLLPLPTRAFRPPSLRARNELNRGVEFRVSGEIGAPRGARCRGEMLRFARARRKRVRSFRLTSTSGGPLCHLR